MTGTAPGLLHIEEIDSRGRPTGHARCDRGDGTFPGGLLAHNTGLATCEACINWEGDDEPAPLVLPNEDFDQLAATLDQPAQPVPELVDLFRRPRVAPPADEADSHETDIDEGPGPKNGDHGTCAICGGRIRYQACPTGGWWIHDTHPGDGHDALLGGPA